jgi:hypothetical protein
VGHPAHDALELVVATVAQYVRFDRLHEEPALVVLVDVDVSETSVLHVLGELQRETHQL